MRAHLRAFAALALVILCLACAAQDTQGRVEPCNDARPTKPGQFCSVPLQDPDALHSNKKFSDAVAVKGRRFLPAAYREEEGAVQHAQTELEKGERPGRHDVTFVDKRAHDGGHHGEDGMLRSAAEFGDLSMFVDRLGKGTSGTLSSVDNTLNRNRMTGQLKVGFTFNDPVERYDDRRQRQDPPKGVAVGMTTFEVSRDSFEKLMTKRQNSGRSTRTRDVLDELERNQPHWGHATQALREAAGLQGLLGSFFNFRMLGTLAEGVAMGQVLFDREQMIHEMQPGADRERAFMRSYPNMEMKKGQIIGNLRDSRDFQTLRLYGLVHHLEPFEHVQSNPGSLLLRQKYFDNEVHEVRGYV